ncbi:Potassium channel, partial [Neophaeococcomyces mojaviensis]
MTVSHTSNKQSPTESSDRTRSESSVSTVPEADKKENWNTNGRAAGDPGSYGYGQGQSTTGAEADNDYTLSRPRTHTALGGILKFRARDDDDPTDWWFASTAIPLLAATFAPMANMLSIAALVVYWRNWTQTDDPITKYSTSYGQRDPQWCLNLNGASLACGFVGNIFLLCNFTRKIRYIIALPVTILLFYVASGILIGITIGMNVYDPIKPGQVYSQGFWHAIIAACLYLINAVLLMVNMLGYFLGHYPQHFDLNDEQRNLILQTMIFFLWLAGGAGVFARVEGLEYPDALYFCDVTLLTIGFGDIFAQTDTGRGLVFPFSVGGTIILGLMVSSIHKFAQELSKENIVKKHIETRRVNTLSRAVSIPPLPPKEFEHSPTGLGTTISRPLEADQIQHDLDERAKMERAAQRTIGFHTPRPEEIHGANSNESPVDQFRFKGNKRSRSKLRSTTLETVTSLRHRVPALLPSRSQKAILMSSEKDRFDKMRDIQFQAKRFRRWYALTMSVISFALLWCVGAAVFMAAEAETQSLTYFQGLYFCYVSLLTIGYGDLSPKSNAGKAFFLVWSLVAVPTMTILVSDLGETAIGGFKRKVLEYGGLAFLGKGRGWGLDWFVQKRERFQRRLSIVGLSHKKSPKLESGNGSDANTALARQLQDPEEAEDQHEPRCSHKTIEELAGEELEESQMSQRLAYALRRVADDMKHNPTKRYEYEEWVEFTRLIRFSRLDQVVESSADCEKQLEYDEAVDGIIEWDWLDSNSPMTSEQSEAEWVLDRLLESLLRTVRKKEAPDVHASASKDNGDEQPRLRRRSGSMSIEMARRYSAPNNASDLTGIVPAGNKVLSTETASGINPNFEEKP